MVNRRGIYKDVYGTPKDREWSDYQVRLLYHGGNGNQLILSSEVISLYR